MKFQSAPACERATIKIVVGVKEFYVSIRARV